MKVSVFGSGGELSVREKETAMAVGRSLAEMGHTIISGGYGGVMKAVAEGAASVRGEVVGYTCASKPQGNQFLSSTVVIKGTTVEEQFGARMGRMMGVADALVFFPGSQGTIAELNFAMALAKFNPKPIIIIGWDREKIPTGLPKTANIIFSSEELEKIISSL